MNDKTLKQARSKILKFCTYRERATKEVTNKLELLELDPKSIEILVKELKEEGFLDDLRFSKIFAGSKFRLKKWGKLKIKRELRLKDIPEDYILEGLAEIEGQAYLETLENLAYQKYRTVKDANLYIKKNKVASFLVSKGYESELVWGILNKI